MKALIGSLSSDVVTLLGTFAGLALVLVGFLFAELSYLAIAGLALVIPGVVYGMR
jgi:ABC-type spermidine/putrescine transport system permease subunit II